MRRKLRKEVVKRFASQLEAALPQFVLSTKSDTVIWNWKCAKHLTFFVMLQPYEQWDRFVVEIGWSDDESFPEILPSHPPNVDALKYRERLAQLWATGPMAYEWDVVPLLTDEELRAKKKALGQENRLIWSWNPPEDEVLPRVSPLVDDAIHKLIAFGLPVFRKVAERRGLNWPIG